MKWHSQAVLAAVVAGLVSAPPAFASVQVPQTPLPGKTIPKYMEPMPTLDGTRVGGSNLAVSMEEFQQQVLPASFYSGLSFPFSQGTYVWGYKVNSSGPLYPSYTIEAQQGVPTTVTYTNNLQGPGGSAPFLQRYLTVDQTIHWADPQGLMCVFFPNDPQCFTPYGFPAYPTGTPTGAPVPAVVHLHGGEVPSAFDGGPDAWFTPTGIHGQGYATLSPAPGNQAVYRYPNGQQATTLWFHDHALGTTRINVYSGLAGFYLLRDNRDTGLTNNPIGLPAGHQEFEILIQDRQFDTNGQWFFPDSAQGGLNGPPPNPTIHPFWIPEFFGDAIVVNGKTWPYLNVEARRYRFRLLNGSNARMYNLYFSNKTPFWQIGTDGGLLDSPVKVTKLFLAPGERADVIVDFTAMPPGTTMLLQNDAKAPFPSGAPPDPATTAQIMQFRVTIPTGADLSCNPAATAGTFGACALRAEPIVRLANPAAGTLASGVKLDKKRQLILREIEGPGGPIEVLLNNTRWMGLKESTLLNNPPTPVSGGVQFGSNWVTELPRVGSTEEWEIINTTGDAHPIHIHLVQFQLINRQSYQVTQFVKSFALPGDGPPNPYLTPNADGAIGGNPAVSKYLVDGTTPPKPNEAGWKDTVVMLPGQVTRVAVRWAPQGVPVAGVAAGTNLYPFDPTISMFNRKAKPDAFGNPPGPGYVWHCHILDHEDNEMMRPYDVVK